MLRIEYGCWSLTTWFTFAVTAFAQPTSIYAVKDVAANDMFNVRGLQCGGTEPFWSVDLSPDTIVFDMMGGPQSSASIEWVSPAQGRPADYILGFAAGQFTGVLLKQACSDGMSDITYPWSIVLINRSDNGPRVVDGCCNQ